MGQLSESIQTPVIANTTLTDADTEYSYTIPQNTKQITFQCQPDSNGIQYDIRYAWATGQVATPTAPYGTLVAGQVYHADKLRTDSLTLYLASATAGVVVETEVKE